MDARALAIEGDIPAHPIPPGEVLAHTDRLRPGCPPFPDSSMSAQLLWRSQDALNQIQRRLLPSHRIEAGEKRGLAQAPLGLLQGLACRLPSAGGSGQVAASRVQDVGKNLRGIDGHALSPLSCTPCVGRDRPAATSSDLKSRWGLDPVGARSLPSSRFSWSRAMSGDTYCTRSPRASILPRPRATRRLLKHPRLGV